MANWQNIPNTKIKNVCVASVAAEASGWLSPSAWASGRKSSKVVKALEKIAVMNAKAVTAMINRVALVTMLLVRLELCGNTSLMSMELLEVVGDVMQASDMDLVVESVDVELSFIVDESILVDSKCFT